MALTSGSAQRWASGPEPRKVGRGSTVGFRAEEAPARRPAMRKSRFTQAQIVAIIPELEAGRSQEHGLALSRYTERLGVGRLHQRMRASRDHVVALVAVGVERDAALLHQHDTIVLPSGVRTSTEVRLHPNVLPLPIAPDPPCVRCPHISILCRRRVGFVAGRLPGPSRGRNRGAPFDKLRVTWARVLLNQPPQPLHAGCGRSYTGCQSAARARRLRTAARMTAQERFAYEPH